ncbi:MAG: hypothetical protein EP347_00390 [Alphaproteobacteria bacterium]|nr:MAG: hypothetical protein EP347_00390 [Alphaproteobacteria bacterium]
MYRLAHFIRDWCQDKRGASAVIFALTLPVMVGFMGLGAEVGLWYMTQREIQTAADVAAYTGALELRDNVATFVLEQEARSEASRNGYDSSKATMNVTLVSSKRVRVEITQHQPRLFSALFSNGGSQDIYAKAEAEFQSGGPACILALNSIEIDALTFTGNTAVSLTSCNIMSNSGATTSINQTGSSDVVADCVYAAGGIDYNINMVTTECDNPVEGVAPSADPYADVSMPNPMPTTCQTIPSFTPGNTYTLQPGRYCGNMSLKGNVDFEPGTYIFDGDFDINSGAVITGDDISILMSGGELKFNGDAEITLSASTSGDYEGILFYQDRDTSGMNNVINGNAYSNFTGAMYFPSNEVTMLGGGSMAGGCTQLVADLIYFSGSSNFEHNCDAVGTREIEVVGAVSLVL